MTTTSRGTELLVWMVVFTIIVTASMCSRFWAASLQKRSLRADDYLVVVAYLCLLAIEIPVFYSYDHNLGAHAWQLSYEDATLLHKIQLSTGITWTLATCSCKIAVLLMYLTLFSVTRLTWVIYTMIAICISYAIVFIPIFLTACSPPSAAWSPDPEVTLRSCRPIQIQEYASVGVNMTLDFIIVLLPMPIIWQMRLPFGKKVFVTSIFSLGLLIVAIMAWRIQTTWKSSQTTDWSYILITTAIQSFLEIWLGILAANLPVISPLLTRFVIPAITGFLRSLETQGYKISLMSRTTKPRPSEGTASDSTGGNSNRHRDFGHWDRGSNQSNDSGGVTTVDLRFDTDLEANNDNKAKGDVSTHVIELDSKQGSPYSQGSSDGSFGSTSKFSGS